MSMGLGDPLANNLVPVFDYSDADRDKRHCTVGYFFADRDKNHIPTHLGRADWQPLAWWPSASAKERRGLGSFASAFLAIETDQDADKIAPYKDRELEPYIDEYVLKTREDVEERHPRSGETARNKGDTPTTDNTNPNGSADYMQLFGVQFVPRTQPRLYMNLLSDTGYNSVAIPLWQGILTLDQGTDPISPDYGFKVAEMKEAENIYDPERTAGSHGWLRVMRSPETPIAGPLMEGRAHVTWNCVGATFDETGYGAVAVPLAQEQVEHFQPTAQQTTPRNVTTLDPGPAFAMAFAGIGAGGPFTGGAVTDQHTIGINVATGDQTNALHFDTTALWFMDSQMDAPSMFEGTLEPINVLRSQGQPFRVKYQFSGNGVHDWNGTSRQGLWAWHIRLQIGEDPPDDPVPGGKGGTEVGSVGSLSVDPVTENPPFYANDLGPKGTYLRKRLRTSGSWREWATPALLFKPTPISLNRRDKDTRHIASPDIEKDWYARPGVMHIETWGHEDNTGNQKITSASRDKLGRRYSAFGAVNGGGITHLPIEKGIEDYDQPNDESIPTRYHLYDDSIKYGYGTPDPLTGGVLPDSFWLWSRSPGEGYKLTGPNDSVFNFPVTGVGEPVATLRDVADTGLISGGVIAILAIPDTEIKITAGTGRIVDSHTDPRTPVLTEVTWGDQFFTPPSLPAGTHGIAIYMDATGLAPFVADVDDHDASTEANRTGIRLGTAYHVDSDLYSAATNPLVSNTVSARLNDSLDVRGAVIVSGGRVTAATIPSLDLQRAEVVLYADGLDWHTNPASPGVKLFPVSDPVSVGGLDSQLALVNSQIDPNNYEPDPLGNPGVFIPVPAALWTIHVLMLGPGGLVIFQPQDTFVSKQAANNAVLSYLDALKISAFPPLMRRIGFAIVQQGVTDLSDAVFLHTPPYLRASGGDLLDHALAPLPHAASEPSVTGLFEGGLLTLVGVTQFSVTAGKGVVIDQRTDPDAPSPIPVSWEAQIATVDSIADRTATWIYVDDTGLVIQRPGNSTGGKDGRENIFLGVAVHNQITGELAFVQSVPHVSRTTGHLLLDLLPEKHTGFGISGHDADSIAIASGTNRGPGINFHNDRDSPNIIQHAVRAPALINIVTGQGLAGIPASILMEKLRYDPAGAGVLVNLTNDNRACIDRIYTGVAGDQVFVMLGQIEYNSISDATEALQQDEAATLFHPLFQFAVFLGWMIRQRNGDIDLNTFIQSNFATGAGGGGGGGAATLNDLTDVDTVILPPVEASLLTFNNATGIWEPRRTHDMDTLTADLVDVSANKTGLRMNLELGNPSGLPDHSVYYDSTLSALILVTPEETP